MKKRYSLPAYGILLLGFLLGIHEGKIALWYNNDPTPITVFPYSAKMLPVEERRALEEGIRFDTMEELKSLLEDYLS